MNKDQVKGAAKDLGGKIQEEVGKLVGSTEQQAKGVKNQVEGKLQAASYSTVHDRRRHSEAASLICWGQFSRIRNVRTSPD